MRFLLAGLNGRRHECFEGLKHGTLLWLDGARRVRKPLKIELIHQGATQLIQLGNR